MTRQAPRAESDEADAGARARIGISGWRYPPWRGTFYPPGLPQRRELEHAAACFDTIELNGSFYSLQTPQAYAGWHAATPDGFVFAVKGPRFVTHMKQLIDVEVPLANFFASGVANLRGKLGPFLWQLPPRMRFDEAKLDAFCALLPRDTAQAAALAARHDRRVDGRAALGYGARRPLRHALEVRHPSFAVPALPALLRRHGVALVVADTAGRWPYLEDVTADFVYVRLHGDAELYVSGYTRPALARWAARIARWRDGGEPEDAVRADPATAAVRAAGRDVYCYFDNDVKVRAPLDAQNLRMLLAGGTGPWARRRPTPAGRRPPGAERARTSPDVRWPRRSPRG
ncbi:MAG TPA: DUF72 domain-containing protein [Casimicrobiaceae bacterium]|nr:DUF72 domain-containing protein [Casimicrobiaceae bacterium]